MRTRSQRVLLAVATALAIAAVMASMLHLYTSVPESRDSVSAWGIVGVLFNLYLMAAYFEAL